MAEECKDWGPRIVCTRGTTGKAYELIGSQGTVRTVRALDARQRAARVHRENVTVRSTYRPVSSLHADSIAIDQSPTPIRGRWRRLRRATTGGSSQAFHATDADD